MTSAGLLHPKVLEFWPWPEPGHRGSRPRHGPGGSAVRWRRLGAPDVSRAQKYLIRSPLALPSPEVQLVQFHEPGIFNYSALLLSEDEDTLFVGAGSCVCLKRSQHL